jgi:hypothetical protein
MLHDAFICHASEDKDAFVRPLAERLRAHHLEIWYDEFTLSVGDGQRREIETGLANSRFGIVVLSPSFFSKGWPQGELDGLFAREMDEGGRLILPTWHNMSRQQIVRASPPLADVIAIQSGRGLAEVCNELLRKIRPDESSLIAARDELITWGVEPPVISAAIRKALDENGKLYEMRVYEDEDHGFFRAGPKATRARAASGPRCKRFSLVTSPIRA